MKPKKDFERKKEKKAEVESKKMFKKQVVVNL